jgi:hypothetical protein
MTLALGKAAAWLAEFIFNTRLGKIVAGGVLVLGLFFGWLTAHDKKTAARVDARIKTEARQAGKVAGSKSATAHKGAAEPGAAERLLRSSCRDC